MTHARAALVLIVAHAIAACASPDAGDDRFTLALRAQTGNGDPVSDVRVWADGRELGLTGASGALLATLHGRAGQDVALSAACPPAYRTPAPRRMLVLRHIAGRRAGARAELTLQLECEPIDRLAVVLVRARAREPLAGVPIRRDGQVVGQTERDGTAHLLLHARPGASMRISLETAVIDPELRPSDPVQTFQVGDEDGFFIFDPTFTRALPPRRVPRRREPVASAVMPAPAPYRIR